MKGGFTTEGTEYTEIKGRLGGRHNACFCSVNSVTSVVEMPFAAAARR
jgi:hypothetical protein